MLDLTKRDRDFLSVLEAIRKPPSPPPREDKSLIGVNTDDYRTGGLR
ncbi:MAG: hypothetical protein ABW128_16965 [Rhizorhabdus sp.]